MSGDVQHEDLEPANGIHGTCWREVPNEAGRLALNNDSHLRVSCVVYQLDLQSFFICSSLSPVVWDRMTKMTHEHDQPVPSDTWIVDHGLGQRPSSIKVFDSGWNVVEPKEEHPTVNRTILLFSSAYGGSATFSI